MHSWGVKNIARLLVAIMLTGDILTAVVPAYAQEAPAPEPQPAAEQPAPSPDPQPQPEIAPEDPATPPDTDPEPDNTEPAPTPEPAADEDEGNMEARSMDGGAETTSLKFQIPTQPKASVDESTGSLTYSYPIKLAEGRAGMTPQLSLRYNSSAVTKLDSIAGLGWDLDIPYIVREPITGTNNLYTDNFYSSSISGNLILAGEDSQSHPIYYAESDNGEYLTYTLQGSAGWKATDKDGQTYYFGEAAPSRQDNPSDANQIYKWMISRIVDVHGNEIQYTYTKDSGQIYPYQIVYTYHPSSPAINTVTFAYSSPENYGTTIYNPSFPVTTKKLLASITATSTENNETLNYIYNLSYQWAQFSRQKLLTAIELITELPSYEYNQAFTDQTEFSYSTKSAGWQEGTHYLGEELLPYPDEGIFGDIYNADFDANGYQDILVMHRLNSTVYNRLALNDGTEFNNAGTAWGLPTTDMKQHYAVVDMNGDGLPDLHPRGYGQSEFSPAYLSTGSQFTEDTSNTWELDTYISEAQGCGPNTGDSHSFDMNAFYHDINNDGKNDILYFGGSDDFRVFLNNGNGFTQSNNYTFTPPSGPDFTINPSCSGDIDADKYKTLIDVNGDSLPDFHSEQHGTYINTNSGFAYNAAYDMDIDEMDRSGFADINGDNLLDYVGFKWMNGGNKCVRVLFNNGHGFDQINPTDFPASCQNSGKWSPDELRYQNNHSEYWGSLLDITADGLPDIARADNGQVWGELKAINNSLDRWDIAGFNKQDWQPMIAPAYGVYLDINSDQVLDFISPNTTWEGQTMYPSKVYMGKPSVPNRLTQIHTPFGANTNITYSTAATDQSNTDASPYSVVSKISVTNIGADQPDMVTAYSYDGGHYHLDQNTGQKRFTGFHHITVTESGSDLVPLRTTHNYYHQANGEDLSTGEQNDDFVSLIGKKYYSKITDPNSSTKKETWYRYTTSTRATEPETERESRFVRPTDTVNMTTDVGVITGTAENYTYDPSIGERTQLHRLGFVSVAANGTYGDTGNDARHEYTEYATSPGSSIVKPKRIDLRTGTASNTTVSRTDYYYDNQSWGSLGSFGDLTKETTWISGDGITTADTTYTYDTYGNQLTATNPRGAATTKTYNGTNTLVVTETNHLGHLTSYEYMTGYLKKVTDPNGRITTYGYARTGLLYRKTQANASGSQRYLYELGQVGDDYWVLASKMQLVNNLDDYSWEVFNNIGQSLINIKENRNHETGLNNGIHIKNYKAYDPLGRQVISSLPDGQVGTGDYQSVLGFSIPPALITETTYDILDRPTAITTIVGTTEMEYSGAKTTTTDANGKVKETKTDAYGNLVEVKEHNGPSTYTTTYTYDVRDLLIGLTDALGNVRTFTYNNAGWLLTSQDLHGAADATYGITSFTYDLAGNQLVETQPNGTTVTRVYDTLDRPTSIDGSGTPATDFVLTYDSCNYGKGRLCNVAGTLPNGVTLAKTYDYAISGVPNSVTLTTLGNSYTTSYLYNRSDQASKVTYPNGTIVRTVFTDWALPGKTYLTLPGGSETLYATITYHHTEKPQTITMASGPVTTYTYNENELYRKTSATTVRNGTTLQGYAYRYDKVGNITDITNHLGEITGYVYDDLYRLTAATKNGSPSFSAVYNAIGNIIGFNGAIFAYSGTGKTNPHAVTGIGLASYTYNDNGNMVTAPGKTLTYNWQNQPTRITQGLANFDSYYDETGERFIYQTPSSTELQIDDSYILRGTTPEITIKLGNTPIGTVSGSTVYSSIADHLDTPVKQIDASGAVAESVLYSPFGAVDSQTGSINTKHGYTGHEEDTDTGLVYAEARYYNPAIGRFLSQDPSHLYLGHQGFTGLIGTERNLILSDPQQLNSYSYVRNNPVNLTDPSGKFAHILVGAGIGALVGLAGQGISDLMAGKASGWESYVGAAAGGAAGGAVAAATAGLSLIATGAVAGGTSALVQSTTTQGIKVINQKQAAFDAKEVATSTILGAGLGAIPGPKVAPITAGQGNMLATGKQILTKLENETINLSGIRPSTYLKMLLGEIVNSAPSEVGEKLIGDSIKKSSMNKARSSNQVKSKKRRGGV